MTLQKDGLARFCLLLLASSAVSAEADTQALAAEINCMPPETGSEQAGNLTVELLDQMCTKECKDSLIAYRDNVETACADDELDSAFKITISPDMGVYQPLGTPDQYISNYNQRCMVDSEGKYCELKLQNNELSGPCDECTVKMFRQMLDSGYLFDDGMMDGYERHISNCERKAARLSGFPDADMLTPTATTSRFTPPWLPESALTPFSELPLATPKPWTSLPTPSTAPLAKGTRKDCKKYEDNPYGEVPCFWLADQVSEVHFAEWNPSVFWWNCTLANTTRYCTLLDPTYRLQPDNAAPDTTDYCAGWYETVEGDTCDDILAMANVGFNAFYEWNPSVGPDCSNLWLETNYCLYVEDYDTTYYPVPWATATASTPPEPIGTCDSDTEELAEGLGASATCALDEDMM